MSNAMSWAEVVKWANENLKDGMATWWDDIAESRYTDEDGYVTYPSEVNWVFWNVVKVRNICEKITGNMIAANILTLMNWLTKLKQFALIGNFSMIVHRIWA